jgi:hypothetical protein
MECNIAATGVALQFQPSFILRRQRLHTKMLLIKMGDFRNVFHVEDYAYNWEFHCSCYLTQLISKSDDTEHNDHYLISDTLRSR